MSTTTLERLEQDGDVWLTRREAAAYLGIAEQTLANNRRTGPKAYKFFGQVRHRKADLDRWIEQRQVR